MFKNFKSKYEWIESLMWVDYIFLSIIIFLSAFCMTQLGDMEITIYHAKDLISFTKNGDFFHYYGKVLDKAIAGGYYNTSNVAFGANYNIIMYIILAIIVAPIRLFEVLFHTEVGIFFYDMYIKAIIVALSCIASYGMYLLGLKMGESKRQAKIQAYVFLGSPILIFGNIIFGQFDVIPLIFIIFALPYYIERKLYKFTLIISIAIALKSFAILLFIPLILVEEKRIISILKYLLIAGIPTIITRLMFIGDEGYSNTKEEMKNIYQFGAKLFAKAFTSAYYNFSIYIFIFLLVCIFCYYLKPKDQLFRIKVATFMPLVAFLSFAMFVDWHPQWLVVVTPFITMAIMLIRNNKAIIIADWGIGLGVMLISNVYYVTAIDNYMLNKGIIPVIFHKTYSGITIMGIFEKYDIQVALLTTILGASCVGFVVLSGIELFLKNNITTNDDNYVIERGIIWTRSGIILAFLLFSIALLIIQ